MSRAYRIRIAASESIRRDISASDEICTELELIEILPPEQMADILRESLAQRGFEERDGKMERTRDGTTVSIDPLTAEVTIRVEASESVEVNRTKEIWTSDPSAEGKEHAREKLKEALRKELERAIDPKEGVLQRKVSEELEAQLGDLSEELSRVSNEVTREALKQKANSLGAIKSLSEDPQAGTLTIKIEV
jgi:hypothetical protein